MKILINFIFFIFFTGVLNLTLAAINDPLVENNFNIKAGIGISKIKFQTGYLKVSSPAEDHTDTAGIGFNTSVGHKWNQWELVAASDAIFGNLKGINFSIDSTNVNGDGRYRIFTLSPLLRYNSNYTLYNQWSLFFEAGPTLSLHTFILDKSLNDNNFNSKKRINFESRGGSLNIGFEEIVPYKEAHPTFFKIAYSYLRSHKIYIVDATDDVYVKTLQEGKSDDLKASCFIFLMGITIF